jgi:hypothetical protein
VTTAREMHTNAGDEHLLARRRRDHYYEMRIPAPATALDLLIAEGMPPESAVELTSVLQDRITEYAEAWQDVERCASGLMGAIETMLEKRKKALEAREMEFIIN